MNEPLLSPDGRWRWTGTEWVASGADIPPPPPTMTPDQVAQQKRSARGCAWGIIVAVVVIAVVIVAVVVHLQPKKPPSASAYSAAQRAKYLADLHSLSISGPDDRLLGYGVVICKSYAAEASRAQVQKDLTPYIHGSLSGPTVAGLLTNAGLDLCPAAYSADSPAARSSAGLDGP